LKEIADALGAPVTTAAVSRDAALNLAYHHRGNMNRYMAITKTRRSPMMPSLKTNLAGRASKSNRDSRTSSEPTQNARIKTSAIFFIARTTRRQTGKRCAAPAS
jgi:hypothetical protein